MRGKTNLVKLPFNDISVLGDEGISIEQQLRDLVNNETSVGITETSPTIYTERKDGVMPEYNIRADKWDIAMEAMSKVSGHWRTERADRLKGLELQSSKSESSGESEA